MSDVVVVGDLLLLLKVESVEEVVQILDLLLHQLHTLDQVLLLLLEYPQPLLAVLQDLPRILVVVDLSKDQTLVFPLHLFHPLSDTYHVAATEEPYQSIDADAIATLQTATQELFNVEVAIEPFPDFGFDDPDALMLM